LKGKKIHYSARKINRLGVFIRRKRVGNKREVPPAEEYIVEGGEQGMKKRSHFSER